MSHCIFLMTIETETLSLALISLGCNNRFRLVKVFSRIGEQRSFGGNRCKEVIFGAGLSVYVGSLGLIVVVCRFGNRVFIKLSLFKGLGKCLKVN